jgi:hypothetical protein
MIGKMCAAILPAMIGLVVLSGCGDDSPAPITGFRSPVAGDRNLVLQVLVGPQDTVKEAKVVKETDRAIEVEVPIEVDDSMSTDIGIFKNVTVTLKAPLGMRTVMDSTQAVIRPLKTGS